MYPIKPKYPGFYRLVFLSVEIWALIGGLVLFLIVLINAYSIIAGATIGKPFAGDFELTEMGSAIAAFCFLPYCQIIGANVTADIFTLKAGPGFIKLTSKIAAICVVLFAAILIWRMFLGLFDYLEYGEFTGILQIPIWWAYIPILVSLFLLFLSSLVSLIYSSNYHKKVE